MLPNLILPGAQKSATTTAAEILASHKDVYAGITKEPHFFSIDENFNGGKPRYELFYPAYSGQRYVLDASQSYLHAVFTPGRIREMLGAEVKFIIILRNPVDRAASGFAHVKDDPERGEMNASLKNILPPGLDSADLDSLIEFEENRTRALMESDGFQTFNPSWDSYLFPFNYFAISRYSVQIENYFRSFARENFLFCTFEQAAARQDELKSSFADFLEMDASGFGVAGQVRENVSAKYKAPGLERAGRMSALADRLLPRAVSDRLRKTMRKALMYSPEKFDADVRRRLIEIFSDDIDRTARLTGLDLSHWKVRG